MKKPGKHFLLRWIRNLVIAGAVIYLGLIGFVVIREAGVEKDASKLAGDYDAIIVLGAQVLPSGEPNTQLKWRLDAALSAWQEKQVPVVVCGAQGSDEPAPEAEVMKKYLAAAGVTESLIYPDPDSYNTNQNLANAAKILRNLPEVRKVLIVTSDYHVPRAMAIAEDHGFSALGLGSPCKPEYWLKNHAREALAWVKYALGKYLHIRL